MIKGPFRIYNPCYNVYVIKYFTPLADAEEVYAENEDKAEVTEIDE